MNMMTEQPVEDWRKKYYDSLRVLDQEERQFREQSLTLRKLIGRLCVVGQGQSPAIDTALQHLKQLIGQDHNTPEELSTVGTELAEACVAFEQNRAAEPAVPVAAAPARTAAAASEPAVDQRTLDALSRLLQELRRDPELLGTANTLDAQLAKADAEQLALVISRIGDLAAQRIRSLEQARGSLEKLLEQMVTRLDEMSRYLAGSSNHQEQQDARREQFTTQVAGEVRALGETVDTGNDLAQIRAQLRVRLDSLDRHLQDYRQREATLAHAERERSNSMRNRIEELESEAQKLRQRLDEEKQAAQLDPLTQIPNRLAWDQRIGEAMARWQRFAQPICIATWDIDHFKSINDTYGHTAGDKVLKIVAGQLAKRMRAVDFLARYGGEEFVMILPATTLEHGVTLVDQIRETIAQLGFHFSGKRVVVTISCGITALQNDDTALTAFERADQAMYRAKQDGRNRVVSG